MVTICNNPFRRSSAKEPRISVFQSPLRPNILASQQLDPLFQLRNQSNKLLENSKEPDDCSPTINTARFTVIKKISFETERPVSDAHGIQLDQSNHHLDLAPVESYIIYYRPQLSNFDNGSYNFMTTHSNFMFLTPPS